MAKNTIRARVEFSYRGEHHTPSATLDLDSMMAGAGKIGGMHRVLAQLNGIDTYSYLYEVMEGYEIQFDEATGVAAECLRDGEFNIVRFEARWREELALSRLREIAERHLEVTDLDQRPALKEALLEAFRAGMTWRKTGE